MAKGIWAKALLLTGLMGTCFTAGVWASGGIEKVEAFLRPDFRILLDGKPVELTDKPVLLYNDTSYLPLRKISEMLNADVVWEGKTQSIYINTRFDGQPVDPAPDQGPYAEITVLQPFPYQTEYLGKTYTLVSAIDGPRMYYRVDDLAVMGVDTGGVMKSRDKYTGSLYVSQEEVNKLWKERPAFQMPLAPLVAGTRDPDLVKALTEIAEKGLPMLGQIGIEKFPKVTRVYLVDAVAGQPGWFAAYGTGERGELILYMIKMKQDEKGNWLQVSTQSTHLDYYKNFFKDME